MMYSSKSGLLSTTVIPMVVMAGVAVGGAVVTGQVAPQPAYAACNPCAVAKCNPCNPCAAAKCNPCAAAKCNPCAAAKCNPCNPFNPCAAACNPCNPCGAGSGGKAALKCAVPRLRTAALCNPCNPCAAANPCNPCNPCGAGAAPELTAREAAAAYDCLVPLMKAAYAKSDNDIALSYGSWRRYSNNAYVSATHGGRYVQNFANDKAKAYGLYERSGTFPVGAQLAKPSFGVKGNGAVSVGPLFIMEKMPAGFNKPSDDWRYTMIMPNGSVFGATKGKGAQKVEFCIGCHQSVTPEQDSVMLMPEEVRVK